MANSNIQWVKIEAIRPYEKNPRDNTEAIPKVAESIKEFGFLSPIVVDGEGVILAGHTRYAAAKKLGMREIPVIYARGLTAMQAKAYRLADNKTGELAKWDNAFLLDELNDLAAFDVDMAEFGFDTSEFWRRQQAWKHVEKYCNLKKRIKQSSHGGFYATSFFEVGKSSEPISKIKENPANAAIFADCLVDYLWQALGTNLATGDWCLMTAPRRRHKEGFHFSTAICEAAAQALGLKFYVDAVLAKDRNRIEPEFTLEKNPSERNVLIFDDIITTGQTVRAMRELLVDAGHVVLIVVGIKN